MKLLCLSYEYPPIGGGGATVCQGLSEALVKAGHHVDVVTSGMKDLPAEEERGGVFIHRVPCRRKHRHYTTVLELTTQVLPSYRKARALIHENDYDLMHCHFVVPSGLVAYMLARRTKLPYILTAHGSDIPGYNPDRFHLAHRLIRPVWRRILRASRTVISPSKFLASLMQQHIQVPVDVIPNGFDAVWLPEQERANRILVVTRMFKRKGVQHFVRALASIETDWEVWIAGDGPYLPKVKQLVTDLGIRARFLGFVARDELAKIYRESKVFVFPSVQENFPVVLLEAMAAGCAVITTRASGCAEVVGDAALTVEAGSVEGLRAAMARLLESEDEIERLRGLGYERVRRFAWQRVAGEHEELFGRHIEGSEAA